MGEYCFVEMQEQYLNEILDIYTHYVLNSSATFHARVLTYEEMREIVFFNSETYKTYVIFEDSMICGYVILAQHKKREAYNTTAEVTIYLKPGFTGKGIGTMAVQYIERYARQQDLHVLIATICGENERSIKLFEKNGYIKCAHYKEVGRKFGKLLDVVAYQKIIN